jgi:hypothetical protein
MFQYWDELLVMILVKQVHLEVFLACTILPRAALLPMCHVRAWDSVTYKISSKGIQEKLLPLARMIFHVSSAVWLVSQLFTF